MSQLKLTDVVSLQGSFNCPVCMKDSPHTHDLVNRWIGVDFDGTLADDPPDRTNPYSLGPPIAEMVDRVKGWLAKGYWVKIMTARMSSVSRLSDKPRDLAKMERVLKAWCLEHLGKELECTNEKDPYMEVLWDDRVVQIIRNTGIPVGI